MNTISKIAVLGASGRTGNYLVHQLLKEGFYLKILLRNPENFAIKNPKIDIVKGNALNLDDIRELLKDCSAVISTLGQRKNEPLTAYTATKNVLEAMEEFSIKRYILLAGLNVDTPTDKKSEKTISATDYMKSNFPEIQQDRQTSYKALLDSNSEWTLIRVPFIEFNADSNEIKVNLEDCPGEIISAIDITYFIVNILKESSFIRQAPFIASI